MGWILRRCRFKCCRHSRNISTGHHDTSKIRNLALVAHIDSGKTTLTESILLTSGYLSSPGTVDTGSTTTDFLPVERERGITIQSASIPVRWKGWSFNLIDTPGHADFGMEVECASRVVDGAVVLLDSVEGVEAQTKGVWKQLDRYNVPTRMLFLNKLDRAGASFRSSILSLLNHRLHPKPIALTLPIASFESHDYDIAEPGIHGIVDLITWDVWKWDQEGLVKRYPLPRSEQELHDISILPPSHPLHDHLVPARTAFLENLAMFSDKLMETLLALPSGPSSYLTVESEVIVPALRSSVLRNEVLPVLCGSAMKHIGTDLVLDYAGKLLAGPLDVTRVVQSKQSPVQMLAWKVSWDKRKGWMTFVRVYSGTLTKQTTLINTTRNQNERVSKLLLLYASQPEEVDALAYGSVGVILGLKHTRTGDTLVSAHGQASQTSRSAGVLRDITPLPAVMSASIIPQSSSDSQPVQDALFSLARTDPSVRIETAEGQLLMHGLGALHLEIAEGRLRDEWGVKFETGRRRVSYRESFGSDSMDYNSDWKTDVHGKSVTVNMSLKVQALQEDHMGDPLWDDNLILGEDGEPLGAPDSFRDALSPWTHIVHGIASTLSNSPHTSLPLSHLHIQVGRFAFPAGANPSVLAGASSIILRDAILKAGMGPVMEPFIRLKVNVNEEHFGKVIKDLTENGGEVLDLSSQSSAVMDDDMLVPFAQDGVYIPPSWLSPSASPSSSTGPSLSPPSLKRSIHAIAPLSKMLDFSNRLRALSGGHGTFEMVNAGFKAVAQGRQLEILREIGRA